MSRRAWFLAFLAAWAACVATGFVRFAVLEPTDFGFTRGLNRLEAWMGWQGLAMALALPVLFLGRGQPARMIRLTRWLPVAWAGLLVAAVLALLAWSWAQHLIHPPRTGAPPAPDRPVTTAPVAGTVDAPPALGAPGTDTAGE